jgi:putative membrane protein
MPVDFFEGQKQVQTWGGRILGFHRSKVFGKTLASCCVLGFYVVIGHLLERYFAIYFDIPAREGAAFGAALSILMVLRTNSAYDRWWEARKSWGSLVNTSRNLALKMQAFSSAPEAEKALAQRWIALFPLALRDHLRSGIEEQTMQLCPEAPPAGMTHLPAFIAGQLFSTVKRWRAAGQLDRLDDHLIDQHISALMDICGVCERIRNTPLPLAHRALIPQLLALYLVLVPISMEADLPNMAFTFMMSYFLIALELVAEEIEEPFGTDDNDLPLDTICTNIARSVRQILAPGQG